VRKVGLKLRDSRSDRQNEVWAGKPVNMASKLAAIGEDDELLVSDRFFEKIGDARVRKSCGCRAQGREKTELWTEMDVSDNDMFDFDRAWKLTSHWCPIHGLEYFDAILALDKP
jgi:class 3 adenylate cyclase